MSISEYKVLSSNSRKHFEEELNNLADDDWAIEEGSFRVTVINGLLMYSVLLEKFKKN